jgi:hypothetical protein
MKKLTPLRAIRKWCLECVGNSSNEVKACTGNLNATPCPLWNFRFGRMSVKKAPSLVKKEIPKALLAYQFKKSRGKITKQTPQTKGKSKVE